MKREYRTEIKNREFTIKTELFALTLNFFSQI
jgi:hypothetical protein